MYVVADAGVLVVLPAGAKPNVMARAQEYGLLGGRVYLPIDGRLDPPIEDHELTRLLPSGDDLYLWHPAFGLIRYSPSAALTV